MYCKVCGSLIDDTEYKCKVCGAPTGNSEKFFSETDSDETSEEVIFNPDFEEKKDEEPKLTFFDESNKNEDSIEEQTEKETKESEKAENENKNEKIENPIKHSEEFNWNVHEFKTEKKVEDIEFNWNIDDEKSESKDMPKIKEEEAAQIIDEILDFEAQIFRDMNETRVAARERFFTFSQKNEEFQELLDKEYEKILRRSEPFSLISEKKASRQIEEAEYMPEDGFEKELDEQIKEEEDLEDFVEEIIEDEDYSEPEIEQELTQEQKIIKANEEIKKKLERTLNPSEISEIPAEKTYDTVEVNSEVERAELPVEIIESEKEEADADAEIKQEADAETIEENQQNRHTKEYKLGDIKNFEKELVELYQSAYDSMNIEAEMDDVERYKSDQSEIERKTKSDASSEALSESMKEQKLSEVTHDLATQKIETTHERPTIEEEIEEAEQRYKERHRRHRDRDKEKEKEEKKEQQEPEESIEKRFADYEAMVMENALDEDEEEEEGRGIAGKVILTIVAIILLVEISILGIKFFAPESMAANAVSKFQSSAFEKVLGAGDAIKGIFAGDKDKSEEDAPAEKEEATKEEVVKEETIKETDEKTQPEEEVAKPDPAPMEDKEALVKSQLENNKNIKTVRATETLGFNENHDYGISDLNNSKMIENNIWLVSEKGEATYYDASVVGTIISFDSKWIDYVNQADKSIFELLKKDSKAYVNTAKFSKVGKIKENFTLLEIGEIRQGANGFYVWAHEEMEIIENGTTTAKKYNWIYYMEPIDGKMKIVNYYQVK